MRKPFIKRIAHFLWAKHINRILFTAKIYLGRIYYYLKNETNLL